MTGPAAFEYLPDHEALLEVIVRAAPRRVRVVGGDELLNLPVDEVRHAPPGTVMANGIDVVPSWPSPRAGLQVDVPQQPRARQLVASNNAPQDTPLRRTRLRAGGPTDHSPAIGRRP